MRAGAGAEEGAGRETGAGPGYLAAPGVPACARATAFREGPALQPPCPHHGPPRGGRTELTSPGGSPFPWGQLSLSSLGVRPLQGASWW